MLGQPWRHPVLPIATLGLAAPLVGTLFHFVNVDRLREFFVTEVDAFGSIVTVVATAAALAGPHALTHYWRDILRVLTPQPRASELPRAGQSRRPGAMMVTRPPWSIFGPDR